MRTEVTTKFCGSCGEGIWDSEGGCPCGKEISLPMKEGDSMEKNVYYIGDEFAGNDDSNWSIAMTEGDFVNISHSGIYLSRTKKPKYVLIHHEDDVLRNMDCRDFEFMPTQDNSPNGKIKRLLAGIGYEIAQK